MTFSPANERVYNRGVERLRSPERIHRLEVERVKDLCLQQGDTRMLLDIGTGSALFAEAFFKAGASVAGVDTNPEMIEAARAHLPEGNFLVAPAEHLPFIDGSFDATFFGVVFHEVSDYALALREAYRVSRHLTCILEWQYKQEDFGPPPRASFVRGIHSDALLQHGIPERRRNSPPHTGALRAAQIGSSGVLGPVRRCFRTNLVLWHLASFMMYLTLPGQRCISYELHPPPSNEAQMSLIELENVTKVYQTGEVSVKALTGVSLHLEKGWFVSFIGPSGSGKSTLLNLIGVLDKPTQGTIRVNGTEVSTLDRAAAAAFRGKTIGFVFQNFNLIPVLTVFENVEYPLLMLERLPAKQRRDRVLRLLEKVGMTDQREKYPNQISGGQKQRVAVARALVTNPLIVLADEPTANLDHDTAFKVIYLMHEMTDQFGTTFVFSTHDQKIVGEADVLHTLEDGAIVSTVHGKVG